jgi:hypothetical protein
MGSPKGLLFLFMKIQTFTPIAYKKCPIYIRRMNTTFEYLTVINNEIYQHHIELKPQMLRRIFYPFGLMHRYSKKQIASTVMHLQKMAEATIDTLAKDKKIKSKK